MILKFQSLGHQVSHLPLLKIDKVDYEHINFLDYKAIIFTSTNAVKFLDLKKIDKNLLCFCVGNATEKKARAVGFQNVISAEGNVENLKELILRNFDQKDGKMIYVSGETISVDLDQQLLKEGYNIKRVIMEGLLVDNAKITKRVANALQDDDEEEPEVGVEKEEEQPTPSPEKFKYDREAKIWDVKGQPWLFENKGGTRKKKKKRRRRKTKRNRKRRKNKHSRKRKRKRRRKRKTRRN